MRQLVFILAAASALAACSAHKNEGAADNGAAVGNASAGAFTPPTVTSRADYGGRIERRFHKLDKNGDDKLSADEFPRNGDRMIKRGDKDGDGTISSDEWGAMMLARFDRQDRNKDGSVSSDERGGGRRAARRGERDDDTLE